MPKMTHWRSPDTIDVTPEKAAVYLAQGWSTGVPGGDQQAVVRGDEVTAVTRASVNENPPAVEEPKPAKKAAAKKATKKS